MTDAETADEHGLVGLVLDGRYHVTALLGRGGMATVYAADDQRLGRRVVIKIPRLDALGDEATRRRFLAEVRDHSRHEHPHILGILDQGQHRDIPFAVLQYLGGGDLSARLRAAGGHSVPEEILGWLRPVAQSLDYIHARGCLHRDVKPANILFDDQGHPFLSDFGISTALDVIDSEAPTIASQDQLTVAGMFVGSPAYAPPEAMDRVFTPGYDQYALATVVYLALSGALPFDGQTNEAILIAKTRSDPAPMRTGGPASDVPPACEKVIRRALSRAPGDRYPSCTAFADAFEAAARVDASRGPGRRIAIAGAVAALLFAGVWPFVRSGDPGDAPEAGSQAQPSAPAVGITDVADDIVLLGSPPHERDAALALCEAHAGRCDPAEFADEVPHPYAITAIETDAFEVTNAAFSRFIDETGLVTRAEREGYSWDGPTRRYGASWREPGGDILAARAPDVPVVHVTFDEAQRYCESVDGRLPTADEWEAAARGTDRRIFPWGNDWDASRLRWVDSTAFGLEPIGSHPTGATPTGLHDLAGSVWEWTDSGDATERIIKGGSWDARNPAYFRAAALSRVARDTSGSDIGFRCVRDVAGDAAPPG